MEHDLHGGPDAAIPYDFRQYDRIWQRVSPSLTPFAVPAAAQDPGAAVPNPMPAPVDSPCCMGAAAREMLGILEDSAEEELADARYYQAFAREAPSWTRAVLRQLAAEETSHARQLMVACYLTSGQMPQAAVSTERIYIGHWCAALRQRYHEEACGGLNYLRLSQSTADPCLSRLLTALSEDEYRHAEQISGLLVQALGRGCNCGRTGV